MTNVQRSIRGVLFAAGASLAAASMGNSAMAAVDVRIDVPGIVVDTNDPYYYSPNYCAGCWYGEWGGRTGYHRGGGRPWERAHFEADHHMHEHGRDVRHEGHR